MGKLRKKLVIQNPNHEKDAKIEQLAIYNRGNNVLFLCNHISRLYLLTFSGFWFLTSKVKNIDSY